eukprot:scaffold66834_cov54-Phaeocystis_antarctica.AAC.2
MGGAGGGEGGETARTGDAMKTARTARAAGAMRKIIADEVRRRCTVVAREEAAGRARPASGGMGVVLSYASMHLSCGEHKGSEANV